MTCAGAPALPLTRSPGAATGVRSVFNLGQTNTVDAQSVLTGNPGRNPLLKVVGTGTAASIRANAGTGIAVNGVSTSGTGQYGQSTSGNGLYGTHTGSTGGRQASKGRPAQRTPTPPVCTARTTPGGPGVYGNAMTGDGGSGLAGTATLFTAASPPVSRSAN